MSSEDSFEAQELARRLGTTVKYLDEIKAKYQERVRFYEGVETWLRSPRVFALNIRRHRDPKWDGIPDDVDMLLKKTPVKKRKRVVMMTESEQLARHAAGVDGQGKRESLKSRALKDVYPDIQKLCGVAPKHVVIREAVPAGQKRGRVLRKEASNKVAQAQKELADWLTGSEVDVGSLQWFHERTWPSRNTN